jgi:nicotinamidase-related amidase
MAEVTRGGALLDKDSTGLVIIDVQEGFRPVIDRFDEIVRNIAILAEGFAVMGRPVIVTEQYPKGLGRTVAEVEEHTAAFSETIEKLRFSACGVPAFDQSVRRARCTSWVVCGIESHVCVNQTVADLIAGGFQVHVADDAVSSRTPANKTAGLRKMRAAGAHITSTEMALFEMLEAAGTAEFKAVSKLVR